MLVLVFWLGYWILWRGLDLCWFEFHCSVLLWFSSWWSQVLFMWSFQICSLRFAMPLFIFTLTGPSVMQKMISIVTIITMLQFVRGGLGERLPYRLPGDHWLIYFHRNHSKWFSKHIWPRYTHKLWPQTYQTLPPFSISIWISSRLNMIIDYSNVWVWVSSLMGLGGLLGSVGGPLAYLWGFWFGERRFCVYGDNLMLRLVVYLVCSDTRCLCCICSLSLPNMWSWQESIYVTKWEDRCDSFVSVQSVLHVEIR